MVSNTLSSFPWVLNVTVLACVLHHLQFEWIYCSLLGWMNMCLISLYSLVALLTNGIVTGSTCFREVLSKFPRNFILVKFWRGLVRLRDPVFRTLPIINKANEWTYFEDLVAIDRVKFSVDRRDPLDKCVILVWIAKCKIMINYICLCDGLRLVLGGKRRL